MITDKGAWLGDLPWYCVGLVVGGGGMRHDSALHVHARLHISSGASPDHVMTSYSPKPS